MLSRKTTSVRNRPMRFGLKTLLGVVACVAAYLAGHRVGFQQGYIKAADEYGVETFPPARNVSDFVIPMEGISSGSW